MKVFTKENVDSDFLEAATMVHEMCLEHLEGIPSLLLATAPIDAEEMLRMTFLGSYYAEAARQIARRGDQAGAIVATVYSYVWANHWNDMLTAVNDKIQQSRGSQN